MARRRLSRSYKRRRRRRVLIVLGLIGLTVLLTLVLTDCNEQHMNLRPQVVIPDAGDDN